MALKRLQKEMSQIKKTGNSDYNVHADQQNFYIWYATIKGKENTPYFGGRFHLKIQMPPDYPFKPPRLNFTTKIFHPGVRSDGFLCCCYVDFITTHQWSPALTILKVIQRYQEHLTESSMDQLDTCSNSPQILELYRSNRKAFWKTAEQWTIKYATEKAAGPEQTICSICLNPILAQQKQTRLGCSHGFHQKCLAGWHQKLCPNCQHKY